MRLLSTQELALLAIVMGHLSVIYDSAFIPNPDYRRTCEYTANNSWSCTTIEASENRSLSCVHEENMCKILTDIRDCLLPQLQCISTGNCIRRSFRCNGINECFDGSDEWGCETTLDSTTSTTMPSGFSKNILTTIPTNPTALGTEDVTTSYLTTAKRISHEAEAVTTHSLVTSRSTLPDSENSIPSLSTTAISIISNASTTDKVILSSTRRNYRRRGGRPRPKHRMRVISSETANVPSSSATVTSTSLQASEENSSPSSTNTTQPDFNASQPCPENYCMNNAKCEVVQDHYRCVCPSSHIGEFCEIELGNSQHYYEYAVSIIIVLTLIILCSAVVLVGIHRYKRLTAWKSKDKTSRTLSQLSLTSHDME